MRVPSLRERTDDIPLLIKHFIGKITKDSNQFSIDFNDEQHQCLANYEWPGNVRELENLTERTLATTRGSNFETNFVKALTPISKIAEPFKADEVDHESLNIKKHVENIERRLIKSALTKSQGNKAKAARLLDISERSLWYKVKKFKLD